MRFFYWKYNQNCLTQFHFIKCTISESAEMLRMRSEHENDIGVLLKTSWACTFLLELKNRNDSSFALKINIRKRWPQKPNPIAVTRLQCVEIFVENSGYLFFVVLLIRWCKWYAYRRYIALSLLQESWITLSKAHYLKSSDFSKMAVIQVMAKCLMQTLFVCW